MHLFNFLRDSNINVFLLESEKSSDEYGGIYSRSETVFAAILDLKSLSLYERYKDVAEEYLVMGTVVYSASDFMDRMKDLESCISKMKKTSYHV